MDLHNLSPIIKPVRTRRSSEEWRELMAQFSTSGQAREQFCKERDIAVSTFDYWRRKLKRQADASSETSTPVFVELTSGTTSPDNGDATAWDVELQLGASTVLRLRRPTC